MPRPHESYLRVNFDTKQVGGKIDEPMKQQPWKGEVVLDMVPLDEQDFLNGLSSHLIALSQVIAQRKSSKPMSWREFGDAMRKWSGSATPSNSQSISPKNNSRCASPKHNTTESSTNQHENHFDFQSDHNLFETKNSKQHTPRATIVTAGSLNRFSMGSTLEVGAVSSGHFSEDHSAHWVPPPESIVRRVVHRTFQMLDIEKNGYLSPQSIHHAVVAQSECAKSFDLSDARRALVAIIQMSGSNRKSTKNASNSFVPADGMDYASFTWLLTGGNLLNCIENRGHSEREDAILRVHQACRAIYDKCAGEEDRFPSLYISSGGGLRKTRMTRVSNAANSRGTTVTTFDPSAPPIAASTFLGKGRFKRFKGLPNCRESEYDSIDEPAQAHIETNAKRLEMVVAVVIIVNLVVTGVSADVEPGSVVWQINEYVVKVFFLWEAIYKLYLYGFGTYFCGEERAWNLFDFSLVIISVVDFFVILAAHMSGSSDTTSVSDQLLIIKVVRLSRLARMIRLLRFPMFAEMRQMILGVLSGLRVLFWAMVLFNLFIYLLAIVLNSTIGKDDVEYRESFRSVYWSMFTIFRCMTDDCAANDGTPLAVHLVKQFGGMFYIGYILTYLFISLGLLNLIMAIFVENVNQAAHKRRQDLLNVDREQMESHLRKVIDKMLRQDRFMHSQKGKEQRSLYDASQSMPFNSSCWKRLLIRLIRVLAAIRGVKAYKDPLLELRSLGLYKKDVSKMFDDFPPITREVFNEWLERDAMKNMLEVLAVDCNSPMHLFDVLDADMSGLLDVEEIVNGLMYMRGPPEKSDMIATMLSTRNIQRQLWELHQGILQMHHHFDLIENHD